SNPTSLGAQNFTLNGNIGLNGTTRTITGTTNGGQVHFGGSIGTAGETAGVTFNTTFTAAGSYVAFILDPNNVNNYTGQTTVNNGSFLVLEGTTANGAIRGSLDIEGNGVVDYIYGTTSPQQIADTSTVTVNSLGNNVGASHFDGLELRGANEAFAVLNGHGKIGLGSGTLMVAGGTFTGIIEDGAFGTGGSLIENGNGTLTLSGKNTYTGVTAVLAGTLQAGLANTIPANSIVGVAAGATFDLHNFSQAVGSISDVNGSAGGRITLGSGTMTVGNAKSSSVFSGAISGTGGLAKVGGGTLALTGINSYTGLTTVTRSGLLIAPTATTPVLSSASRLVVGGTTVSDGGTFQLNGVSGIATTQILNGLTVNPGSNVVTVNNLGTTTTLDLRGAAGTAGITRNANGFVDFRAVNGTLGLDAIIKTHQVNNASGILGGWATVNGGVGYAANNGLDQIVAYTGYTDISAMGGTVPNGSNLNVRINSVGTAGNDVIAVHPTTSINTLTQNSATASTISLAAGTLKLGTDGGILVTPGSAGLTIGATPNDGVLTATSTGTITLANNSTSPLTINSAITNVGGPTSLRLIGGGTTVFTGTNTYSGTTTIIAGTLRTDLAKALPSTSAVVLNGGAALDLNSNSQTVASITDGPNGGGNLALGTATLTTGSSNSNSVLTGVISGSGGSLVKVGTGSLTLSGANSYSGGTTLTSGTLIANGSTTDGSGTPLGTGTLTIKGGTLGTTLLPSSGFSTLPNAVSLLGNFSISTNSNPTNPGAQNFVLNGNIGLNGVTRTITGTTNQGQVHFGGSIGSPGETAGVTFNTTFTAAGSYVAFIFDPNNFNNCTGQTTVNNGSFLVFEGTNPDSAIRGNLDIEGNGVVDYIYGTSSTQQIADTSTVTVNSLGNTLSGSHFDGLELRGASEIIATLNGHGKVGLGSGRLIVGGGNFTGIIEDGAFGTGGALVKNNANGTLILGGKNTYTGYTSISAGTLQAGVANAISTSSIVGIALGATFDLHNFSQSVGSIADLNGGGGVIKLGTATLTTGSDGRFTIFSGQIQNGGKLVKVGSGGLKLTGANTYTGGTAVNGGILLASNTTGSGTGTGAVTVNSTGTLGGSGTIAGAVTLNSGGIIAPGAGTPGVAGTTLHATSMMWNAGGTLSLQLGAAGDELVLTGALTKGGTGTYQINILDDGLTATSYTLATFASTTFAQTNFTLSLPAGDTGNLILTGTSLVLDVTSVAAGGSSSQHAASPGSGPVYGDLTVATSTFGGTSVQTIDSGLLTTSSAPDSSLTFSPTVTLTPTPEPGGIALLAVGALSLLGGQRRRRR
ncbi:MAG TPA: autotransporter-associated beta strand repeat-containing protein, partial [Chthoniobacter sp.]|nr:autotransporter-associated beta strand repeat-containing protein [Chthoniobacter sp.]